MVRTLIEPVLLLAIVVSLVAPFLGDFWITALVANFVPQLFLVGLIAVAAGWIANISGLVWLGVVLA